MIVVIDYGIGNLGSAQKALSTIGVEAQLVSRPKTLSDVDGVVLPGVGSFGACVEALRSTRLDSVVFEAVEAGVPLLGICVGMQMLYEGSEESPEEPGLGLLSGRVARLTGAAKVPHMSWNRISYVNGGAQSALFAGLEENSWFYFVHSFAPEVTEDSVALCSYGDGFSAAAAKGMVFGTQFHPEKSSTKGLRMLENFARLCSAEAKK